MTGINKKRLGIWGAIFVVFLLIGGAGVFLSYTGHGTAGRIRTEVKDYITKFNGLTQVRTINNENNKSIKASISDKGILVDYKNDKINSKLEFSLKEDKGTKYLETVYNKNETSPETIVRLMIDAVGLKNGTAEGKIFDTYQYSDFYSTTLAQGVKFSTSGNNVKVQINLKANILDNGGGNTTEDTSYVIIYDTNKSFEDLVNYTAPSQFVKSNKGYELSTENNTCTMEFNVVSVETEKDAISVANMIARGEKTSVIDEEINGTKWNKVSYPSALGGTVNRYITDANGNIVMIEYNSYYSNDECNQYLDTLLTSVKVK